MADIRVRALASYSLASVLVAGALAGCFRHEYPAEWAAPLPVAPRACPAIAGTYDDVATRSGGDPYRLGSDVFVVRDTSRALDRRVVVEQFGDDSLAVAVLAPGDSGRGARRTLRRDDDYTCGAEGLELRRWIGMSAEGVLGFERLRYRLRRATDGALVAQRRATVAAIVLLIPIAGSDEVWYRYAPRDPGARKDP